MSEGRFSLRRPCPKCPFRSDVRPYMSAEWAERAANGGLEVSFFPCHKTLDGDGGVCDDTKHCAGAMILLEIDEKPNQAMRIAEVFGDYDRSALDMDSPVYESFASFLEAYGGRAADASRTRVDNAEMDEVANAAAGEPGSAGRSKVEENRL